MDEPKPCPFCGGTNLASPPGMPVIVCGDCDCAGPLGIRESNIDKEIHQHGVRLWNKRAEIAKGQ